MTKKIALWTGLSPFLDATDDDLTKLADRGVGMVMLQLRHLYGLGGTQRFTGVAVPDTADYATQRKIRDTKIAERCKARGIELYIGWYFVNYNQNVVPFSKDWFDDAQWATVVSSVRGIAQMAKAYGFAGFGLDGEEYPGASGSRMTWYWDYPGRTQSEGAVRAKVKQRGEQMADAIATFPNPRVVVYYAQLTGSFEEAARGEWAAKEGKPYAGLGWSVSENFYEGVCSRGLGKVDFWDAWFYKGTARPGWNDWNVAVADGLKRHNDWVAKHATGSIGYANFTWIDTQAGSPSEFDDPKPPATVKAQLTAARDVGTADHIPVYCYNPATPVDGYFSYQSPNDYVTVMKEVAGSIPTPPSPLPVPPPIPIPSDCEAKLAEVRKQLLLSELQNQELTADLASCNIWRQRWKERALKG
jgi:hypothetical protein